MWIRFFQQFSLKNWEKYRNLSTDLASAPRSVDQIPLYRHKFFRIKQQPSCNWSGK